jgi:hypothetical protein
MLDLSFPFTFKELVTQSLQLPSSKELNIMLLLEIIKLPLQHGEISREGDPACKSSLNF